MSILYISHDLPRSPESASASPSCMKARLSSAADRTDFHRARSRVHAPPDVGAAAGSRPPRSASGKSARRHPGITCSDGAPPRPSGGKAVPCYHIVDVIRQISSLGQLFGDFRKPRRMPGIEASRHVDHVAIAGALEQAARNHAAIAALAVNRTGRSRSIGGSPCGKVSSARHCTCGICPACHSPSRRTSRTSIARQLPVAQFLVQFLRGNLRRLGQRKPRLLPAATPPAQIPTQILDAHTSQPQPSFFNLRVVSPIRTGFE
jgi:hypothetical protein